MYRECQVGNWKLNYKELDIDILALNVLTLKNEENIVELIYALEDRKWDIVGLSEVRRMGENIISYPDYMFYHIGETPGLYGVGNDKKKNRMETMEKYISKTGGIKKAYRELKNSMNWIVKIKSDRRKWNPRRTDILGTATSYYKKLYENYKTEEEIDLANTISILEAEVEKAIDTQSIDKTPGPDGINNEILKQDTGMFNDIIDTEIIPQQWTEFNIILLYKKGDKYEIGNYRLISLMSNTYKVFAKIILKRIERTLDEHQSIEQAGFRKNYSECIQSQHLQNPIRKAYHLKLGKELDKETRYFQNCSRLFWNQSLGDWTGKNGINVDDTLLIHLRFADNIVLFAKTPEDITRMIEDLAIESERVGLKLNPEKTRVMTNGNKTAIEVGNTEINNTDEYVYLGQLITLKEPMREEVKRIIINGWRSY
ncbi:Putative uncharacterized transposon-derived protein F52C9.6 [Eumeta japonica]|uniref:Uncharacterized transposon-derived protein F52C9.6 n=1 Tax=Eumeta variegata TaxID=151549 RepID=A0A4C1WG53_EUMVA|nr:Putative uncharacterized transposon-derived protein F52C9.6 [Eumeta japonica]